jgi:hypothetical protein
MWKQLPGTREALRLRNAQDSCLAWQPARRCVRFVWSLRADCEGMEQGMGEEKMKGEGIWKAAAWLASAAVAVACILKTGNADFLQILAFPFFVCILT